MALISVDLPHPFGPRIATCSPRPIFNETSFSATVCPRITVTCSNSIKGGTESVVNGNHVVIVLDHTFVEYSDQVADREQQRIPMEARPEQWRCGIATRARIDERPDKHA